MQNVKVNENAKNLLKYAARCAIMATVTGGTHRTPPTGAALFTENAASATDSKAAHGRAATDTTAEAQTTGHRPRQARQPAAASDRGTPQLFFSNTPATAGGRHTEAFISL